MHCLEIIIERNLEQAGKEAGQAVNDGDYKKAHRITSATSSDPQSPSRWGRSFLAAYWRERNTITSGPNRGPAYYEPKEGN